MDKDTSDMKPNPKETANVFSILFFWWMRELFMISFKRNLEESDIYRPIKADESEKLTDLLEKYWNRELDKLKNLEYVMGKNGQKVPLKKESHPKLYKAVYKTFWLPYFIIGICSFIQCSVVRVLIPILQSWIIKYFINDPNEKHKTSTNEVMIYITFLIITNIIAIMLLQHSTLQSLHVGMRIRIACSSLLYRKLLRLNTATMNQTGTGQIMNLLSNDVIRFDQLTTFLNYIWIMPFMIVIIGTIMWQNVGISCFVGIGALLIIVLPGQGTLSFLNLKLRTTTAPLTDRRVQLMSELIAGIQVVKMYAWEKPFSQIVSVIRKLEIKQIKFSSYVRATYLAIIVFTERLTVYFTIITFVLMGNNLTADVAYAMSTYFNILQLFVALYFPQGLILLGESIVSFNRLEDFLLMDEVNTRRFSENTPQLQFKSQKPKEETNAENQIDRYLSRNGSIVLSEHQGLSDLPVYVKLQRVSANWISGQMPPTLCNINLIVKPGQLCAVVGAVGSGKSSILHLLLKELNLGTGSIILTQGSSKYNIPGNLSTGYFTNNPNLRISYASQEPWLFGGTVRDNILFGQSYDKTRYMQVANVCALTKDFRQFPQGDMTMVGDRGVSLSGGQRARINLARAIYKQADIYLLDDPLSAVDTRVARHLYGKCITEYLHGKTRILVTHQLQFLKRADHIIVLDRGFVKMQGNYNELVQSNKDFIGMLNDLNQARKEEDMRRASEMSKRITITRRTSRLSTRSSITHSDIDDSDYVENSPEAEMSAHGRVAGRVYKEYLHNGGNNFMLFVLLMSFIISQVATTGNDYWLSYWTTLEDVRRIENTSDVKQFAYMYNNSFLGSIFTLNPDGLLSTMDAIYVYTFCIIACIATTLFRSFLFMKISMNSSRNLHNIMFFKLLQARMFFFHNNPSGRILNRFSKDIGIMDEWLPKLMLEAFQGFCVICGIMIMEVIINQWMLIMIAILVILFFFVTKSYMKIGQDLKRLEGVMKSPIFSHVNATLNGLPTIRSSGIEIEKLMRKRFDELQDRHSGTWYLFLTCSTAFVIVADLITCLFVACICFSLIPMNETGNVTGSKAGLAISQSLILIGCLQYVTKQFSESVSLMTSVERILQYTNLPKEEPITSDNPPPPTWPSQGQLILKNVNMKYHMDDPPVLKNLNVSIEPGWKVGVVGRTGAGKSSLISALFRLFNESLEGEIKIDGWDTSTMGLSELRCKISIIPQEPVLFSESLRYNLDPFNRYDDMKLWEVLRQVELNDVALDHDIFSGGHNFSVGQRQLICLARAILRNNRLLVLDEATANIDSQ
ncbi:PREDICTED: multidrug resistance-associated protein 4-like [Atta cephalotes]|uniref:ABC transmembrane type-1 domain-containing protein n=1 Tax=Atta cephalotes TaxID=12957 RepID=A0A158NLX6_ATTCE|nr:PREDICTED: multidrug resistance-associated protein 4-like [Atta cephalotes]